MEMNKVFKDGLWSKEINVSDFVHTNITPYEGDASFLAGPTERTKKVWNEVFKRMNFCAVPSNLMVVSKS